MSMIDFRSDTVTKPTKEMYEAMVSSPLGDHVNNEDPTVNKLQERCAQLFGKEAALFVPTGTMANLISIMVHCESRFQEVIIGSKSHIVYYEVGNAGHLAGVQLRSVENKDDGTFDLDEVSSLIRDKNDVHYPSTRLICVENTHNKCGGKVLPLEFLKQVRKLADENDIKVHMDGARLLNAAVYLKVSPAEIVQYVDSVTLCFSKGLCAPAGSVVAGSKEFIDRSKWMCKALGGTMRQVGVLAGPALVSLDTIYPRLHEDHEKALQIAKAIKNCGNDMITTSDVHTNIVIINISNIITAEQFCHRLLQVPEKELEKLGESIRPEMWPFTKQSVRLVVHQGISQTDLDKTIIKFQYVIQELVNK
ncbi:hypothetical protein LOTGIDRAFT_154302 [Lottia gigantea]|uniref:Aromatic amino acid beta-eliminating lyase/threonine aldolase domain-containing protein n=1 Tax=Lottia gigantea TaxID=225164 RepID=V3ZXS4_LOTGI|nr:hypothetical protein LOTGIDRAFT_154302 [Lottia gigantea]ESO89212.1 hypothetical protein LOTGIDRAFT_154302 [Lottia gigantea]